MNDTTAQKRPNRPGRLISGVVALAAGALLGAFGAFTLLELDVAAQQRRHDGGSRRLGISRTRHDV